MILYKVGESFESRRPTDSHRVDALVMRQLKLIDLIGITGS